MAGNRLMFWPSLEGTATSKGRLPATRVQNFSSAARAPSRSPLINPWARTTAFMAPALVPLTPSKPIRPSSRSWSSTPQVNAPWAPPPCKARLTVCWLDLPKSKSASCISKFKTTDKQVFRSLLQCSITFQIWMSWVRNCPDRPTGNSPVETRPPAFRR